MVNSQFAYLAGGCFWCLEAVFQNVRGVTRVISGYSGGTIVNPRYEQVSTGLTGHAETVEIEFDPSQISYPDLLSIYFGIHDPTTTNRQGNDVGTQYRSVIFYTNKQQKKETQTMIDNLTKQKLFKDPIVTEVIPFEEFFPAEEYHQNYFAKNPQQGYCQVVVNPKLTKLKKDFQKFLKSE